MVPAVNRNIKRNVQSQSVYSFELLKHLMPFTLWTLVGEYTLYDSDNKFWEELSTSTL
jgi:hypothetical protein